MIKYEVSVQFKVIFPNGEEEIFSGVGNMDEVSLKDEATDEFMDFRLASTAASVMLSEGKKAILTQLNERTKNAGIAILTGKK